MEFFERVKTILFKPKDEWTIIEAENAPHATVFAKYLLILSLIPALAFFGSAYLNHRSVCNEYINKGTEEIYARSYYGPEEKAKAVVELEKNVEKNFPFNTKWEIIKAICQLVIILGGAYIAAIIINSFSEQFGSTKNFNRAFSLVAYSYTPLCFAGILYAFNSFAWLVPYIGLYGLYLLYIGIVPLLKPAANKKTTCFVISLIAVIAVWAFLTKVAAPEIQKQIVMIEAKATVKKLPSIDNKEFDDAYKKALEDARRNYGR